MFYYICCVFSGVRVCGSAQRLHDPHAARAQFWHHQVSLEQTVPCLSEDAEGRVSAEHVSALRFRRAQIHDSGQQQLAERIVQETQTITATSWSRSAVWQHLYGCVQRNWERRVIRRHGLWSSIHSGIWRDVYQWCSTPVPRIKLLIPSHFSEKASRFSKWKLLE